MAEEGKEKKRDKPNAEDVEELKGIVRDVVVEEQQKAAGAKKSRPLWKRLLRDDD